MYVCQVQPCLDVACPWAAYTHCDCSQGLEQLVWSLSGCGASQHTLGVVRFFFTHVCMPGATLP